MKRVYRNWIGLAITIIIPAIILAKYDGGAVGPAGTLVLALSWPLAWGGFEWWRSKKADLLAVIGVVGVLLTGGIGLWRLDVRWLAVKEAAVPLSLALAILGLSRTKFSPVEVMIRQIIDVELIETRLTTPIAKEEYRRLLGMVKYLTAASFGLSAALNFILASILVNSQAGTEAFNQELARLTVLSYPVIVIPSMLVLAGAMVYFINHVNKQTGLKVEEVIRNV